MKWQDEPPEVFCFCYQKRQPTDDKNLFLINFGVYRNSSRAQATFTGLRVAMVKHGNAYRSKPIAVAGTEPKDQWYPVSFDQLPKYPPVPIDYPGEDTPEFNKYKYWLCRLYDVDGQFAEWEEVRNKDEFQRMNRDQYPSGILRWFPLSIGE